MKRIGVLLLILLLFSGCQQREASVYRVVTAVQVEYNNGSDSISRTYSRSSSIQSVLTYLRILHPYGPVEPEYAEESTCKITLHYSQGPDSVYLQQGTEYLKLEDGTWAQIDSSHASLLYPMLLLLPSDV